MTEITFDQLTEGQKNAYNTAIESLSIQGQNVTINGPAGTGKTTLTKLLIKKLVADGVTGIQLAAPTHQAKKVLTELSGMEARTIHSLLKINPSTYEDVSTFEQSDVPDLSECRVLICDEASMYDKKLFQILIGSIPSWCTIIALGDVSQIRPVSPDSSIPEVSLFFLNPKFKQVSLTEVKRSNAPIIEVATEIRNGGWIRENVVDGSGVHNMFIENGNSIQNFLQKYFEIVKTPEDLFNNRMLAYTNASVTQLNKIIRKKIYETDEPFINGEVLVMQEPLLRQHTFEGKKFTEVRYNNGELVKILDCKRSTRPLRIGSVDEEDVVKCWELKTQSLDNPDVSEIMVVIEEEAEMNRFQKYLSSVAHTFKTTNNNGKRPNWRGWWILRNQFSKVKALPCGTIHKSQGSSVDNVFLYTPCIHKADSELAQQLLYVGATRARHNVFYV